jgi:hypothetical protein
MFLSLRFHQAQSEERESRSFGIRRPLVTCDGGGTVWQSRGNRRRVPARLFRILDARLTPGVADAAPFAENWAVQSARTPHAFEPSPGGKSTPLGTLNWLRFSITLWLPGKWKEPAAFHAARVACSE